MGIKFSKVDFTYYKITKKNQDKIKYANRNINLEINSNNEFIAIVGHTGSGKSTFVQLINSLLLPKNGDIEYDINSNKYYKFSSCKGKIKFYAKNVKGILKKKKNVSLKPIRKHVGLVFQFPEYQIFEVSVLKDIMFGPKNFTKDSEYARNRANSVAKLMNIEDLLEKNPFTLSGGQMRKVAIAGILASEPDILILDEPSVGLDPHSKDELLEFIKKLNEEEHKTIIMISHDMDIVSKYAKRVIVMNKGEIKFDGAKDELFRNEELVSTYGLTYPSIVQTLKGLKEKLGLDIDEYQYNTEDACNEIERCIEKKNTFIGDQNE